MNIKKYFEPKLSVQDKIRFFKRLSLLLSAAIPLDTSIEIIIAQSSKKIQPIFKSVYQEIKSGKTLAEGLQKFPTSFSKLMVSLVTSGEKSGLLKENCLHIAKELERKHHLKRKIVSSILYPCIIAASTVLLSLFLIIYIFPKVQTVFTSLHAELPLSTKSILILSKIISNYGISIFLFLLLLTGSIYFAIKKYFLVKEYLDVLILRLPLVNTLIRFHILSSIFRSLGMMLNATIPIAQCLSFVEQSLSNSLYRKGLMQIFYSVTRGKKLSTTIHELPHLFPDITIQFIELGERTGTLADRSIELSEILDEELENKLRIMVSIIEPALMIIMGLCVGFLALSMITPMYEITQNIKH